MCYLKQMWASSIVTTSCLASSGTLAWTDRHINIWPHTLNQHLWYFLREKGVSRSTFCQSDTHKVKTLPGGRNTWAKSEANALPQTCALSDGQEGATPLVSERSQIEYKLMRKWLDFSVDFLLTVNSCQMWLGWRAQLHTLVQIWPLRAPKTKMETAVIPNLEGQNSKPQNNG